MAKFLRRVFAFFWLGESISSEEDPVDRKFRMLKAKILHERILMVAQAHGTDTKFVWEWFYQRLLEKAGQKVTPERIVSALCVGLDGWIIDFLGYCAKPETAQTQPSGQKLSEQCEDLIRAVIDNADLRQAALDLWNNDSFNFIGAALRKQRKGF